MLEKLRLWVYDRLSLNALARGDYARADTMLERIRAIEGDTRRVLHNLALVRLGQGDHAGAEALMVRQIEVYGTAPALRRALAEVAYHSGDREKAVARLTEALADRDCPDRALLTKRAALVTDADAYARALAGKRDFAEGNALLAKGDHAGALAAFRRAADADPTDFVALNNIGTLLLDHVKDRAAATLAFEKAAALSDQPVVRRNIEAARHPR